MQKSKQWEESLRKNASFCYVFCGGSEVRMGIDPVTMNEKHGIAAINAGIQAGNGARCNAQSALEFVKPGDILVISGPRSASILENNGCTHSGINFCYTQQGLDAFTNGLLAPSDLLNLFYGDAMNYSIHAMRILTRPRCIYRYTSPQNAQITESGRVEVFLTYEQKARLSPVKTKDFLCEGWRELIVDLKQQCKQRRAHLIMYISRAHCHKSNRRSAAQAALYFTQLGIPVIRDPYLGAWEESKAFSDTNLHLSKDGGIIFSDFLAEQLKNGKFWSEEELINLINAPH